VLVGHAGHEDSFDNALKTILDQGRLVIVAVHHPNCQFNVGPRTSGTSLVADELNGWRWVMMFCAMSPKTVKKVLVKDVVEVPKMVATTTRSSGHITIRPWNPDVCGPPEGTPM